jgi:hypothetical protein
LVSGGISISKFIKTPANKYRISRSAKLILNYNRRVYSRPRQILGPPNCKLMSKGGTYNRRRDCWSKPLACFYQSNEKANIHADSERLLNCV